MVDPASIEQFRLANSSLSKMVRSALEAFFLTLDLSKPEAARDALLEFMPTLTTQYGAVAATLAAEWYDELRAASGAAGRFRALTAASVPSGAVEAKVRYLAGHLWTPEPAEMLGGLLTAADKYVKQPGRDTMAYNAKREGVRWARVPTGAKTCSWCLALASRDAVYLSEKSAGSKKYGTEYHGRCDCEPVRLGKNDEYPPGYLPDNFYDMYSIAKDKTASDPEVQAFIDSLDPNDRNRDIKGIAFALRRTFPDHVKDGVHSH